MQGRFPSFGESIFCSRPIVIVEDHAFHITELLNALSLKAPELFSFITIVNLEPSGQDTNEAVAQWLNDFPKIQIASSAVIAEEQAVTFPSPHKRHLQLPEDFWSQSSVYCQTISNLLRHHGILLQDIELSTLSFIPADRWWDSTFLATTVRGIMHQGPPKCLFVSNKRGYSATFGAELLAAGHDPRDVLDKDQLELHVIGTLKKKLSSEFPLSVHWADEEGNFGECRVASSQSEVDRIEIDFDLVLWTHLDSARLAGRSHQSKKTFTTLAKNSAEYDTWHQLISAKLKGEPGIEVVSTGNRLIGCDAAKAEATNSAARHIHSLRKRLTCSDHLVTDSGRYRLTDSLTVGIVELAE